MQCRKLWLNGASRWTLRWERAASELTWPFGTGVTRAVTCWESSVTGRAITVHARHVTATSCASRSSGECAGASTESGPRNGFMTLRGRSRPSFRVLNRQRQPPRRNWLRHPLFHLGPLQKGNTRARQLRDKRPEVRHRQSVGTHLASRTRSSDRKADPATQTCCLFLRTYLNWRN